MKYIIKNLEDRTILVKADKEYNLFDLLDKLYEKGYIDLDKKEDFEFGKLEVAREDEFDFLTSHGFKAIEL